LNIPVDHVPALIVGCNEWLSEWHDPPEGLLDLVGLDQSHGIGERDHVFAVTLRQGTIDFAIEPEVTDAERADRERGSPVIKSSDTVAECLSKRVVEVRAIPTLFRSRKDRKERVGRTGRERDSISS